MTEPDAVQFFEAMVNGAANSKRAQIRNPSKCVNWLTSELFGRLRKLKQQENKLEDERSVLMEGVVQDEMGMCSEISDRLTSIIQQENGTSLYLAYSFLIS
jgi:hypothetical protein